MPLIDIQLVEGAFDADQKADMVQGVTDTMVTVGGEPIRGVTWVRVSETPDGDWSIGGRALTASDMRALANGVA